MHSDTYDVIIAGGSYAGLSAAMALGRSLRKVLVIDNGKPCNRQTPHSHNFLTQDGATPAAIAAKAKEQVQQYPTVHFLEDTVTAAAPDNGGFILHTQEEKTYRAAKLLFATGVRDELFPIEGFAECWGISVLHCPYCHGYEVAGQPTAILYNGKMSGEFAGLIHHWTKDLVFCTNGPAVLTIEEKALLAERDIPLYEKAILRLEHQQGKLQRIIFEDGESITVSAIYSRVPFQQHCPVPEQLGCKLTEQGLLIVNEMNQTTVPGIFAAGDAITPFRTVSMAVAGGTMAGAVINRELIFGATVYKK